MKGLLVEVVAVVLVVIVILCILVAMGIHVTDYKSAMLVGVITGVLTHLGFEAAGLNKYYCENGYACRQ